LVANAAASDSAAAVAVAADADADAATLDSTRLEMKSVLLYLRMISPMRYEDEALLCERVCPV